MSITLELPAPLQDELVRDALRAGQSPEERATLLLSLTTALLNPEPDARFRKAVEDVLPAHNIEPERFWEALRSVVNRFDVALPSDLQGHPPPDRAGRTAGRRPRPSALGKYAHLGLSSEEHAREKQEELDREEERFRR